MVAKLKTNKLSVYYNGEKALNNVDLEVKEHEILSIIGPARSGKTTLLKIFNRMIDLIDGVKIVILTE